LGGRGGLVVDSKAKPSGGWMAWGFIRKKRPAMWKGKEQLQDSYRRDRHGEKTPRRGGLKATKQVPQGSGSRKKAPLGSVENIGNEEENGRCDKSAWDEGRV